jgi:two-component system, chemotaxis family, chemotaxis protein CheY
MTVLVVEDEQMLLKAIEMKLQKVGKKVVPCLSAEEALQYLKGAAEKPDVIWLDYYLKDMNGLEFMLTLKTDPSWANIPVMVVSNSATQEKVSRMLALGAKKYVLKAESRLEDLVGMLDEIVSQTGSIAEQK